MSTVLGVPATLSRLTTLAATLSVALVAVSAACAPSGPTVDEYRSKSPTLAKADRERLLRIGIQDQLPLMSEWDEVTKRWKGFDAEIAEQLAHEFGFTLPGSVEFVRLTTEKRISSLQSGAVHLVVADFTINEERCREVRCAGPYLITTPEIMIRRADENSIKTIDDLKKRKVCTTGGSTSSQVLEKYKVPHSLLARGAECAEGVRNGEFDAHCTDDVAIAGRVQRYPELMKVDMPFAGTEPLGVAVPLDDPYLQALVAHYFRRQLELGRASQWQAAYDANLALALGRQDQPSLIFFGPPPSYPALRDRRDLGPDTR